MPTNTHIPERDVWKQIAEDINRMCRLNQKLDYEKYLLRILLRHPVGLKSIENHIRRFYINCLDIEVIDGEMRRSPHCRVPLATGPTREEAQREADDQAIALGIQVAR